jgi:uncharacterized protein YjbI with pentapeptide repeats
MGFFSFRRSKSKPAPGSPAPVELDQLRSAMTEASSEGRNAFFYFALFGLYFMVAVAGTTHENLLRGSTIAMPGLGVGLPIVGFYAFVPLLFILLHLYVLLQVFIVARTLNSYRISIALQSGTNQIQPRDPIASSFLTTQWLFGYRPKGIYTIVVWMTLIVLPLLFLVVAQVRFLPYHLGYVTWLHRLYILIDMVAILPFWLLVLKYRNQWLTGRTSARGQRLRAVYGALSYLFLASLSLVTSVFVFLVATVPGDAMERCLVDESRSLWCSPVRGIRNALSSIPVGSLGGNFAIETSADGRRMLAITHDLFEGPKTWLNLQRNLVVRYAQLVVAEPPPVSAASTAAAGEPANRTTEELAVDAERLAKEKQAAWEGKGINLRGRDLRFADLSGSDLRGADFRGADLDGAIVENAKLLAARIGDIPSKEVAYCPEHLKTHDGQGNEFCRTRMTGADLSGSDLRFVEGWKADLRSARLTGANLEGADLRQSSLQGAWLAWATLTDARLQEARLDLAVLREITAPGVNFEGASLNRVMLRGSDVHSAKIGGADLEAADLSETDLTGAVLNVTGGPCRQHLAAANLTGAKGFRGCGPTLPGLPLPSSGVDFGQASVRGIESYQLAQTWQLYRLACGRGDGRAGEDFWAPIGVARQIWDEYDYAQSHDYAGKSISQNLIYLLTGVMLYNGQEQSCKNADQLNNADICLLHKIRNLWEHDNGDKETALSAIQTKWWKDHPEELDDDKGVLFSPRIQLAAGTMMRECHAAVEQRQDGAGTGGGT